MDSFATNENVELFSEKNVPMYKIGQFQRDLNFLKPVIEYQFKGIIL